jgi:hypothetical protein
VPNYILENADWGRIGVIDVARRDTSCGIATSQIGMVLVYLDKSNERAQESITIRLS